MVALKSWAKQITALTHKQNKQMNNRLNKMLFIGAAFFALGLLGCASKNSSTSVNQTGIMGPQGASPEQLEMLLQQSRATTQAGSQEQDKQGRFFSSSWSAGVNSDRNLRAVNEAKHSLDVASNFAAQGVTDAEFKWNQPAYLEVDNGELLNLPVAGSIRIGAVSKSDGDAIAGQINSLAARDAARGVAFATFVAADGTSKQTLLQIEGTNRVNQTIATLDGIATLVGKILNAGPVGQIGESLVQTVQVLKDNGEEEVVTITAPAAK
jgi:hypothetical protein